MRSPVVGAGGLATRLLPPPSRGLDWPRGHRRLSAPERARLLHYERLMGLAHLTVLPVALAAAVVRAGAGVQPSLAATATMAATVLVYAFGYHVWVPRHWLSHAKVVLGLVIDTALVTLVVHLTGGQESLLVFLYYLIIVTSALTLESRALLAMCGVISVAVATILPFDPTFTAAPRDRVAAVLIFVASLWLVGFMSAAGAGQIQQAEQRLVGALRAREATARENALLSQDLAARLAETRALATSLDSQRDATRRLADMVLNAQEEERRRVARELHDEANQTLAAMMTAVDLAEAQAGRAGQRDLEATLARLRRLASTALADLQRIALELRPPALDEFGLVAALGKHVRERTAGTALAADLHVEGRRRRLADGVEVALYRIAQEALANAQKHSRATHLHVRLRFLPGAVRLDVSDDGCGFPSEPAGDAAPARTGLGMAGMRERAAIVGGSVEVTTRPGGGTRISAVIPVIESAAASAGGAVA